MKKLLPILLLVIIISSCKKHGTSFWFTGMQIIDTNQQFVRWVGQPDNDWLLNKYTFTTQQLSLLVVDESSPNWYLTQMDTVAVTPGTNPVGISSDTTSVYYQFTVYTKGNCVFTYALTDMNMNIIQHSNIITTAGESLPLLITIPAIDAKAGEVYRIYYGFSSAGHTLFASGWGDIGLCKVNYYDRTNSCF